MMTFSQSEVAQFFNAQSRSAMTATEALKELSAMKVIDVKQITSHLDRICQKNGLKINEVTSHQAGNLLITHAWGRYA